MEMISIKKFIDKVSMTEGRNGREIMLPISEARLLRDELSKLLLDLHSMKKDTQTEQNIKVEIIGGKW